MMNDLPIDINLLPFNDALEIYDKMRQAYLDDDKKMLSQLQKKYPSLFEEETASMLRSTVEILGKMKHTGDGPKFTIH
jgi:hypothetical protein